VKINESEMKRLYVGGLSHSVTDKDLKDRFGKFGKVEDVELKTRNDEQGVPFKTFGYINITISDADLKKCLSVLNKSQWKGGTLQIETVYGETLHQCETSAVETGINMRQNVLQVFFLCHFVFSYKGKCITMAKLLIFQRQNLNNGQRPV
uniref:RRM domain-containing protein n=1 Tax=Neogobius melanostomus TaxID=47308 RepID=A0A8C6UBT4_9GOBI